LIMSSVADDLAQRYQVCLVGVGGRDMQDAGHGLPQVLQVGDLLVDGVQVGVQQGDDLAAGWRLAPAQADDRADFGQAEPEVAGLADEAEQLDVVLGVAAVAGGGAFCGRQEAARLVEPDCLGGQARAPGGLADGEDLGRNICLPLEAGA